ncbi:MAG: inositol 2-dehydrogenase [Caldilineaceae bacterium SB0664_bin_27]|uniref:Inositol 2-dehydrogenase n=1 Tax=Caldilineaceae bacterium SB0664_bin_27 TaxID=2605260 RepID=A0A6B0YYL5_9CHLR|nr:inositol 2-dehydrogenase [Caldilineaceae bacterium SB0664_bin_27]
MEKRVRFAIIGAGRIGQVHAENLTRHIQEAEVVAIADVVQETAEQTARRFGIAEASGNPAELFSRDDVDAVAICSSTETHADFIIQAAHAGMHAFCEKPIALNLPAVDAALAAVKESGTKLQIGFNRRFDPNFRGVRDAVRNGEVGDPYLVQITSRDPEPPPLSYVRDSGGLFLDMMIHDFDMVRFLLDDEVEEVSATGAVRVDPAIGEAGDIDTAIVTLRYKCGALGVITNSRQAVYGGDQRVEVLGSLGSVLCENNTPDRVIRQTEAGVIHAKPLYFFIERYLAAYADELRSFIRAILNDAEVEVTGYDGRAPVVLALAAGKSYREKRSVAVSEVSP